MKFLLFSLLLLATLDAKVLITPYDAIHKVYGKDVEISKKNKLLNAQQASQVSKLARAKLKTKIYRIFKITKDGKSIAYGVLTLNKMRSKDAAILFIINLKGEIISVQTVAFNEPPEFAPSQKWQELFLSKNISNTLRVGKDIPTLTGATLSARGYAQGARIALAVFEVLFKK